MINKTLLQLGGGLLGALGVFACAADTTIKPLSPEAEDGGKYYALCQACHNPQLNPPLAPPMFGVKRQYRALYPEREPFIEHIVAFVKNPDPNRAVMHQAVNRLGLMPAQALPEKQLRRIAAYIWEYSFAPPCEHWQNAVFDAVKNKRAGEHLEQDRRMMKQLCPG